jgi:hypothetical protein
MRKKQSVLNAAERCAEMTCFGNTFSFSMQIPRQRDRTEEGMGKSSAHGNGGEEIAKTCRCTYLGIICDPCTGMYQKTRAQLCRQKILTFLRGFDKQQEACELGEQRARPLRMRYLH